jgi:hypothetical protein
LQINLAEFKSVKVVKEARKEIRATPAESRPAAGRAKRKTARASGQVSFRRDHQFFP